MARLVVCLLLAAASVYPQTDTAIRRFAFVAGVNDGGYERVRLRYAASDAQAFSAVIEQLGGVRVEDRILLVNPSFAEFQDGLRRIRSQVQAAVADASAGRLRCELIVYYSGHADDEGLLLGRERFPYSRLRREVSEVEADVRIAVVDSCSSGSLTRSKGGARRPAFLFDSSTEMKGYAFLTSSSEDEVAQESDRIGGSFFTHFLVAGLRGAADSSGDGLVTLNEAYAFAFGETLASTERTQYGPQHPAYDIALTGKGDLVLTDLRQTAARLVVGADVGGRLFVRDRAGDLVAEISKRTGDILQLALEPGVYTVRLQEEDRWAEASVSVSRETRVERANLRSVSGEATARRGGGEAAAEPSRRPADDYENSTFHFSLLPEIGEGGIYGSREQHAVSLNLLVGNAAAVNGVVASGLASLVADRMDGAQLSGIGNVVGQDLWGLQLSGLFNYVGRDAGFYQYAGVANIVRGELSGLQQAGVAGVALGGVRGAQLAGVGVISGEDTIGAQAAGLFSYTEGELRGLQASLGANIGGDATGLQLAGVFNYADSMRGAQLSTVNITDELHGAQAGVVNIAGEVHGVQIGLVNICERIEGVPIGLINYEREGSQHLELAWQNDRLYGALRLGAGSLYTLFRAAMVRDSEPLEWSFGGGLGFQLALGHFFLDFDASVLQWLVSSQPLTSWDPATLKPEVRVAAGFAPRGGLGVLVGASAELEIPGWHTSAESQPRITPAAFIGVQMGKPRGAAW